MSIYQDIQAGRVPARLTVADLYALQDAGIIDADEHFELEDGEVIPLAAAKSSPHERTKSQLIRHFARTAPNDVRLFVEATIALDDVTTAEPDLALWPRAIESQEVRGPDLLLVVEVAVSSLPYDVGSKARRYARHGVRDYWVVDAIRRTIRIHRNPVDGRYTDVDEVEADQPVEALLAGVTVRLDQLD